MLAKLALAGVAVLASTHHVTVAGSAQDRQCEEGDATCVGRCSSLQAANWNVAAINNNPFEYWITYDNIDYQDMMGAVQDIIIDPAEHDVPISSVFTDAMFGDLKSLMLARGWDHVHDVEQAWEMDFRSRPILSGFLKDKLLGKKRLASMPDRTTNTINTDSGPVYRPSVINCFAGSLSSTEVWWREWQKFMFESSVTLRGEEVDVADLLVPIRRSKYPLVTEEEERMSIPLQTLSAAIFDAILVHLLNEVAPNGSWETIRASICDRLNLRKVDRTLEILESPAYTAMDVIFMQEVAGSFLPVRAASRGLTVSVHHGVQLLLCEVK